MTVCLHSDVMSDGRCYNCLALRVELQPCDFPDCDKDGRESEQMYASCDAGRHTEYFVTVFACQEHAEEGFPEEVLRGKS